MMSVDFMRLLAFTLVCIRINVRCQEEIPDANELPPAGNAEELPIALFDLPSGFEEVLTNPLQEGFTCDGKPYGYYADLNNNCQVFHVCNPVILADGQAQTFTYSFFCPNQTVFSQESLTCMFPTPEFDCEASIAFADQVNAEFGRIDVEQAVEENLIDLEEPQETILREERLNNDAISYENAEPYPKDSHVNYLDIFGPNSSHGFIKPRSYAQDEHEHVNKDMYPTVESNAPVAPTYGL